MVRVADRKRLQLVNSETKEILAEGFTPHVQGYIDGPIDGLENTIGERAPKTE